MTRGATHVAAGLIGMALGWILVPYPLAAIFSPTQVTWDAASCPAGVYTITSTAQGTGNRGHNGTFAATSTDVTLPRPSVVQEFPDLPPGTYAVTATARRSDGQTFRSDVQAISVFGASVAAVPDRSGSRRPPSSETKGVARPRRSTSPSDGLASRPPASAVQAPAAARIERQPARSRGGSVAPPARLDRLLIRLEDITAAAGIDWRRIEIVDTDADGVVDLVTVEAADGTVLTFLPRIR
jgi:hypothetical protein